MKVSIVVPVYNVENYIENCINSVLSQTFSDFEAIFVNDGSTDKSGEILEKFKDDRIKIIHKEHNGPASAVNMGIKEVKGEYITFLDSDDWIKEDYISKLYNAINDTDSDIAVCDYITSDGESLYKNRHSGKIPGGVYEKEEIENMILPYVFNGRGEEINNILTGSRWAKIFRTELIKKNFSLYREDICHGEDKLITFSALFSATRINYIKNEFLYYYRISPNSITTTYNKDFFSQRIKYYNYIFDAIDTVGGKYLPKTKYYENVNVFVTSVDKITLMLGKHKAGDIINEIKKISYSEELKKLKLKREYKLSLKQLIYILLLKCHFVNSLWFIIYLKQSRIQRGKKC